MTNEEMGETDTDDRKCIIISIKIKESEYRLLKEALSLCKYFSIGMYGWETIKKGRKTKYVRPTAPSGGMSIDVAEYHIYKKIEKIIEEYESSCSSLVEQI